jgi:hypothetical protein
MFAEFPFLRGYVIELETRLGGTVEMADAVQTFRNAIDSWAVEAGVGLPLRALAEEVGISRRTLLAFVLFGLVEEDPAFAGLFAALQQPVGQRRPSVALARTLLSEDCEHEDLDAWALCRPLVDAGLVEVLNGDAPRSEWLLRVPPALWSAARGECGDEPLAGTRRQGRESFTLLSDMILSLGLSERLIEVRRILASGQARALVVRGMAGSERVEVVGAVAREIGRGILEVEGPVGARDDRIRLLGPLCSLTQLLPVFRLELGPGETFELPRLPGYSGPLAVVLGPDGGLTGFGADSALLVCLEPDGAEQRLRHWRRALGTHGGEQLQQIAQAFSLSGRHIREVANAAASYAALERRATVTVADVRQAARMLYRPLLDSLATRLDPTGAWEQLVLNPVTETELRELERRCRHRERLVVLLGGGFPGGMNRGVRALFEGPSGTGKTLAARVLAAELGVDLYRVDLAAIVNKYVGETEKNLSRVLARAEDLDVVLLFDEGDALMTRRTDVKSANDRYANLETNYLLQRLESYTGILIVTTNAGHHIDPAFRRRIDVAVKFHSPDAEQRWRLWHLHLPSDHALEPAALEDIAVRYALAGGQIRNAALHATLRAIAHGGCVTRDDVTAALHREYGKAGAACPVNAPRAPNDNDRSLSAFVEAIS